MNEICYNSHPVHGPCHGDKGHKGNHWSNGFGNWIRAKEWGDCNCKCHGGIGAPPCGHCYKEDE